jgi:hypothetical protein
MREVNIESTVASVRSLLYEAEHRMESIEKYAGDDEGIMASADVQTAVESAFAQLLMVAEALGLTLTYDRIRKSYVKASRHKDGLAAYGSDPFGQLHLLAAGAIRRHVQAVQAVFGTQSSQTVSKDLVEILRNSLYAVTDRNCSKPPQSEDDVHHRIEAVLRCVFPDLDHKPAIAKPIKNFQPDTGLPSIRTVIEYKFVGSSADVKRVADEILADTRGYIARDWDKFLFVIYETRRLKQECDWNRLLERCGAAVNTKAIVLCGESVSTESKEDTKGLAMKVGAPRNAFAMASAAKAPK